MEFFPYFAVVSCIVVLLNAMDLLRRDKIMAACVVAAIYSVLIIWLAGVL